MRDTTNTKESIEPKEKPKGGQLLEELSLRDYFAAKAMQGMAAGEFWGENINGTSESPGMVQFAKTAYFLADAMIAERDKP